MGASWYFRPNPEDQINRKPGDWKNDQRTKDTKHHETKKMNSTVLNLSYGNPVTCEYNLGNKLCAAELQVYCLLCSFITQNILGRKLPKVTLVGNAIPPNKAFLGWHPSVSLPWNSMMPLN